MARWIQFVGISNCKDLTIQCVSFYYFTWKYSLNIHFTWAMLLNSGDILDRMESEKCWWWYILVTLVKYVKNVHSRKNTSYNVHFRNVVILLRRNSWILFMIWRKYLKIRKVYLLLPCEIFNWLSILSIEIGKCNQWGNQKLYKMQR